MSRRVKVALTDSGKHGALKVEARIPPAVDLWAGQGPSSVASPKMTRSLSHTQDFHSFNFGFSDDR